MIKDKFSAVWVSHSSIGDYLKCPRAYYLKNMYRDPKTNHKISIMQPPLALGQAVHDVVESLSQLPTDSRFLESLLDKYDRAWQKISGKMGGFANDAEETTFKERGSDMIKRIMENPGPLANRAIKIRQDLPYFWLSEEENIILCGKIDWLEYLEESQSVHIIDFKTGKFDEDPESLQLPIYILLVKNCQIHPVTKASYWYLDRDVSPSEVALPDAGAAYKKILTIAQKIQLARKLEHFKCSKSEGCRVCRPYESIISGEAAYVGVGGYSQDIYTLSH